MAYVKPVEVAADRSWIRGGPFDDDVISLVISPFANGLFSGTRAPLDTPQGSTGTGHWGVDLYPLRKTDGTPVVAHGMDIHNMGDEGVVINRTDASVDPQSGNFVEIKHNDGWYTRYGHMLSPSPYQIGDTVPRGAVIGQLDSTGLSTGDHLHCEWSTRPWADWAPWGSTPGFGPVDPLTMFMVGANLGGTPAMPTVPLVAPAPMAGDPVQRPSWRDEIQIAALLGNGTTLIPVGVAQTAGGEVYTRSSDGQQVAHAAGVLMKEYRLLVPVVPVAVS